MFDQPDRSIATMSFSVRRLARISIAVILGLAQLASQCRAADRVGWIVQAALRAEIDLKDEERTGLIDAALLRDPKSPDAHWARGDVFVRGQWQSLENVAADANASANLKQYRDQRNQAEYSVKGQVRLAEFCRSHQLPAQERAHWNAVLVLAPNHAIARRRLGQVIVNGNWIDKRQLEELKKNERATSDYMQKHAFQLVKLSKALQEKTMPIERVLQELCEYRNPLVIRGLESFFSSTGEDGARCTVETAAAMPAPEASLSLVRHALEFPAQSVRNAATNSLKRRDENSFVPALLAALQCPVEKQDGFAVNDGNQLIWRQKISFETQDSRNVTTLDRVFQFPRSMSAAVVANSAWTQQAIEDADRELNQFNRSIEEKNERVMQLLAATTEDKAPSDSDALANSKKTPDDWWNWWNDRIESYPADSKAVLTRYQASYVYVPPPATVSRRYECLAAGTPIWTETGSTSVEQIKVGDVVLTKNQRSGELKFAPVLATSTRPPELLLRLKLKEESIRVTGGHPFWVSGKGWIKARALEPGMGLHTAKGVVVLAAVEEEAEPSETYNLIVDECHSYFVGTNLLLSHDNTTCDPVANRVPGLCEVGI